MNNDTVIFSYSWWAMNAMVHYWKKGMFWSGRSPLTSYLHGVATVVIYNLIWRTQTHKLPKQILHPTQNIWHFKRKTFFIYYSNAVDLTHCNTRSYIILQSNSVKLIMIYHTIYIIFQMAINPHTKLYVRYLKGQLDYRGYGWHFLL